MFRGFREFIMRGNVVDLAVGVVMGLAFAAVVNAVVNGLINPLVAAIFGKPNLDAVGNFAIGKGQFHLGVILTALINFVLVAAAVYLLVVVPVNAMRARLDRNKGVTDVGPTEVQLLEQIRDELRARR